MSNWVYENFEQDGSSIGFRVSEKLHEEQTEFQKIEIWSSTDFGHIMALDGCWMVTERENFIYHEMMSHPALFTHDNPQTVLIIGGGDCGTLREVLRHPTVERAIQIEIDERVTRLSEAYFPELCEANHDPRAELLFEDGIAWMEAQGKGFADVIIVDSTDPVGFAEGLFDVPFLKTCHAALKDGGIFVQQSESPLLHHKLIKKLRRRMKESGYNAVTHWLFPQPCYPSGWWSCTAARKGGDFKTFREKAAATAIDTRYYNAAIHRSAQVLPNFLAEALGIQQAR